MFHLTFLWTHPKPQLLTLLLMWGGKKLSQNEFVDSLHLSSSSSRLWLPFSHMSSFTRCVLKNKLSCPGLTFPSCHGCWVCFSTSDGALCMLIFSKESSSSHCGTVDSVSVDCDYCCCTLLLSLHYCDTCVHMTKCACVCVCVCSCLV